jgi:hypothetical protein
MTFATYVSQAGEKMSLVSRTKKWPKIKAIFEKGNTNNNPNSFSRTVRVHVGVCLDSKNGVSLHAK